MPTAITHDPTFTTPVSSTNTAVVRWSGTAGSVLQNSGVLIDGSNNITGIGTIASGAITSSGAIIGTQVDILAAGDLRLQDTTGGQYVALEANGTTTTHTLTLPAAQGAADTFLKNNGSGALTWGAAGGGNLVLVGTAVASSSSTLDITGLDTTYDTYMLVGSDVRPSNQGVELSMRLGDSSGFDSGASDYSWYAIRNAAGSSSYVGVNDAADSRIAIAIGGTGADANEAAGFVGWLHSPGDGTSLSIISGNHSNIDTGNNLQVGTFGGMRRNTVITVDRVQIFFSAGTITSGRFTVLGVKHA